MNLNIWSFMQFTTWSGGTGKGIIKKNMNV
jgi:hypothetical protein